MDKHTKKIRKGKPKANTLHHIQQLFFRTQIILIVTLALFLGAAGIFINIHFEIYVDLLGLEPRTFTLSV